jgi:hypothetical protein
MNAIPAGGGFSFSLNSIGGTWRWTVFASNLSNPGLLYQVQDISTPYGPMNVAMIPLPADVVQAMAQSITDVKNQLKPLMTLVSSQTSFSVGVTEGDPRQTSDLCRLGTMGRLARSCQPWPPPMCRGWSF